MSFKADKILSLAANFAKKAEDSSLISDFHKVLTNYESNAEAVQDFSEALGLIASSYQNETNGNTDYPNNSKIASLLQKQAHIVANCIPELQAIDAEIQRLADSPEEQMPPPSMEENGPETMRSRLSYLKTFDKLLNKFAQNPPEVSDKGPVTWNNKEQTEEDAKTFMQPGGEKKVPGAPGALYRPDVALTQRKLNDMQMRGTINFGAALVPDGIMGPKTQAALNAYKQYIGVPSLTNDLAIQALSKKQDQTEAANSYDPKLGF